MRDITRLTCEARMLTLSRVAEILLQVTSDIRLSKQFAKTVKMHCDSEPLKIGTLVNPIQFNDKYRRQG